MRRNKEEKLSQEEIFEGEKENGGGQEKNVEIKDRK